MAQMAQMARMEHLAQMRPMAQMEQMDVDTEPRLESGHGDIVTTSTEEQTEQMVDPWDEMFHQIEPRMAQAEQDAEFGQSSSSLSTLD